MQSNYSCAIHSKYYLKAHIISVCKYRKKLFVGQLKEEMRNILENIIAGADFTVEVFESDLDHYHFLIRYIPRLSISQIVRRLKTTIHLPYLAKAFRFFVKTVLAQAYFLGRWLLRLFDW